MVSDWGFVGWYYFRDGEQVGPVSGEELGRLVREGALRPDDSVLKGWKVAGKLQLLQSRACVALGTWDAN
jgi:hypothetical protein